MPFKWLFAGLLQQKIFCNTCQLSGFGEITFKNIYPPFSGKRQTFFKAVSVLKNVCNRSSRKYGLDFY